MSRSLSARHLAGQTEGTITTASMRDVANQVWDVTVVMNKVLEYEMPSTTIHGRKMQHKVQTCIVLKLSETRYSCGTNLEHSRIIMGINAKTTSDHAMETPASRIHT